MSRRNTPGLYDASYEHDSCGFGLLAHTGGTASTLAGGCRICRIGKNVASRRHQRRRRHRRWLRHPPVSPRKLAACTGARSRHRAWSALRVGIGVSGSRCGRCEYSDGNFRRVAQRGRTRSRRLARRSGQRRSLRPARQRASAVHPPGVRQCRTADGRGRVRARPVSRAPARRAGACRRQEFLRRQPFRGDHRLQGDGGAGRAAAGVPGFAAQRPDYLRCDFPPALLDQHDARLAPGAAVPHARAQRRDQHDPREPQLDRRALEQSIFLHSWIFPISARWSAATARIRRVWTRCSKCCSPAASTCSRRCAS